MKKQLTLAICLFLTFGLWTALVCLVDIQPIGPAESEVGLATLNGWFHDLTGVHMFLYDLTDILSLIPFGFVFGFAVLGLVQWIKRKKLSAVDSDILLLGGFYVATGIAYIFFEIFAVNFRPVLIEGVLEASYPSSTTMLIICIMSTAIIQVYHRIKNKPIRTTSSTYRYLFRNSMPFCLTSIQSIADSPLKFPDFPQSDAPVPVSAIGELFRESLQQREPADLPSLPEPEPPR